MKRLAIFCALLIGVSSTAEAAQAVNPRGRTTSGTESSTASDATRTSTATARSATTARSAVSTRSTASSSAGTTARAATAGRATVSRTPTTATSSTISTAARSATVTARAGTTQKVLNTGTTINAANENVMVSEACRQKYYGCMDSFCMLDNDSGGRCICSDKNAEYDEILAQIEELDQQSYQMATYGVEKIEMGDSADAAIANANAVAQSIMDSAKEEEDKSLDLTSWLSTVDFSDDSIFGDAELSQSPIEGKEGDALYRASHEICIQQMPECASELSMLQLMYAQQIRSDCSAYENSLKQQKNASAQKLYAAEQALRDAALEQYQTANKYDLGQCTVEFKNCMISTGGCGDDFSGCASIAAFDSTSTRGDKNADTYEIQGNVTSIEIKASTYDILLSKKPLCENVTKQCQLVADQVWDTFLKEVAPQVKSAELIAEDNARQSCVGNISSCFQQACKDTMDPKDPEGSYDLCLTRPEAMLNLCQVPLNACGISTTSASKAQESEIWDFVVARLASMRVNSCTTQVKECLQSEDRCGEDYSQCIGLDTDTIIRMCPEELLVGCQGYEMGENIKTTGNNQEDFYAKLEPLVQGIMLNIDNNLLEECQAAADEAMVTVCGDTENCDNLTVDQYVGANTLEYKICEMDSHKDSTNIDYSSCRTDLSQVTDEDLGLYLNDRKDFIIVIEGEIPWENIIFDDDGKISVLDVDENAENREKIESEMAVLQNNINNAIQAIEADSRVQFCMTGREVQGIKNIVNRQQVGGRFDNLTQQMRAIIATSALKIAMGNYQKKYEELEQRRMQDYVTLSERIAEVNAENTLERRRESARVACVGLADGVSFFSATSETDEGLTGQKTDNRWNYKETITSTFNSETLVCRRCVRTQNCSDPKSGRKYCKKWADPEESCTDIQF